MTMGEYIKKLRLEKGWSQEELGQKVGVNRAAVNKWETGAVENIKRSTIRDLSEIFGVSPCDLMCWNDTVSVLPDNQKLKFQSSLSESDSRYLEKYLMLDEIDKIKAECYTDGLLSAEKYQKKSNGKVG